jgi:hypothetical protein
VGGYLMASKGIFSAVDPIDIGSIIVLFTVIGSGGAVVGVLTTGWAEAVFSTGSTGAVEFGPIFVAQLYLAITAAALVGVPILSGLTGFLFGSQLFGYGKTLVTCVSGIGIGSLVYVFVFISAVVVFQGPGAEQAFGFGDVVSLAIITVLVSTVVGTVAGLWGQAIS